MQVSKNNLIFNADGSFTTEGRQACQLMQIDPKTLKVVTEQDLVKDGIDPHIAAVRAEHLMEKRSKRLEMLENTIIRLIEVKHELIKYNTHTD